MNKTIFNKMNELIQQDYPRFTGLIDLGSCTIHTVLLGKALNSMAQKLIFFVRICILYSSTVLLDVKIV